MGARFRAVSLDPPYLLENREEIGWGTRLDTNFDGLAETGGLLRKASHEPFDFAQGKLEACSRGSIRLRAARFAQDDGSFLRGRWRPFSTDR
jgi:hypothetical protein